MKTRLTLSLWIVLLITSASPAFAPLGTAFTYQGRLKVDGGPADGLFDLRFKLYDAASDGSQVGATICIDDVSVSEGLFTVSLDFGAQFAGAERFLEIEIRSDTGLDCSDATGFVPLSPRQELTVAPHALFSLKADTLDGLDSTAFLQSIPVPLTLSGTSATHIISGENNSTAAGSSGVYGRSTAASGFTFGVYGASDSTDGWGVVGFAGAISGPTRAGYFQNGSTDGIGAFGYATAATGSTSGLWGQSDSAEGSGVFGEQTATSGTTYGVYGRSASTSGVGIVGHATATSGSTCGVKGMASAASYGIGVHGAGGAIGVQGWSDSGLGVFGQAGSSGTGAIGGSFESLSPDGRGVTGWASGSGDSYGGYFGTPSTSGRGVFGQATATSGNTFGGYFDCASTAGYGVYGRASATSGTIYGVRGYASTAAGGFAVYAAGDMGASGIKPFRIDHPDDPENKYLLHYATESPEVINFYRGTVVLDGAGEAVVSLPPYFGKINKDPSYQLTAVGAPMPRLHVADEISAEALAIGEQAGPGVAPPICRFRIAGGEPGAKVSWEVKALRNDLRIRLHGAPVEREKIGPERGRYQHPEYYGQPPEMGMDHDAERERPAPSPSEPAPSWAPSQSPNAEERSQ